ncbi:MAG: MFS transporter [Promethearchaeota archaeon]|jgi:GPH family glycoside/pentoside/hexuronide:cation symporter
MAIQEDLSEWEIAPTKKMIAYGFGYTVVNYLLGSGLSRLIYFYEVEILLPTLFLTLAYVIFAIWNMVNDPLLGFLTDKPLKWTKRWGLRAPWVVMSSIPMIILFFFIWTPPRGNNLMIFFYFIIFTFLFDAFFSIYNDHVYGGFTNQFPSEFERRRAFSIATFIMGIFITLTGIISSIVIEFGQPQTFVINALIMVILLIIFNIIQFTGIKESREMKDMFIEKHKTAERRNFFQVAKIALGTKNFLVSLAGYTISTTATQLASASGTYMFKDVYGLDLAYSMLPSLAGAITFILIIPFWYSYVRKHGFKKTYWITFILHGLTYLPYLFISDIISATVIALIAGVFYSGEVIVLMPVASDTYDEVSIKMGKRQDATFVGMRNFFFRIAFLVVGIVIPLVHVLTNYDPTIITLASQSPLATFGVRIHRALIPMILLIIMGFIFRKYYDLEGDKKAEMLKELKAAGLYRA